MTPEEAVAIVSRTTAVTCWSVEVRDGEVLSLAIERRGATPWWRRHGHANEQEFERTAHVDFTDPANCVLLCQAHNQAVEDHPQEARLLGLRPENRAAIAIRNGAERDN